MNHFSAYSVPVPGGYWGMCRFAQNAQPWPIMEGEKPKVFLVKKDAIIAAQGHVIDHINGTMRRDGEVVKSRAKADALFPKLIKQKGRTKPIQVQRRGAIA